MTAISKVRTLNPIHSYFYLDNEREIQIAEMSNPVRLTTLEIENGVGCVIVWEICVAAAQKERIVRVTGLMLREHPGANGS